MNVEEIEIIVTAKVENAVKDLKKIVPAVTNVVYQVQANLKKIDTKVFTNKINQAVNIVNKKIENLKTNKNNEIKISINNKNVSQQVEQTQKEINSLQRKINSRQIKLNVANDTIDKIKTQTKVQVKNEMPKAKTKQINEETDKRLEDNKSYKSLVKESGKLNDEIVKYNLLLETAKTKISGLSQQTSKTNAPELTQKMEKTNPIELSGEFGGEIEESKTGISGMQKLFGKISNTTKMVTNHIKKMGSSIKSGLGHALKYVSSLIPLKSIYSTLSSCASGWLSSQNVVAQQLTANMEYLKYSMRKCVCTSY